MSSPSAVRDPRARRPTRLRPISLRTRIAALAMVPVLLLAILSGAITIRQRYADLEQGLSIRGALLARQLAAAADYGLFSGNRHALQSIADAVLNEADVVGVLIVGVDGRMRVAGGAPGLAATRLLQAAPLTALPTAAGNSEEALREGDRLLFIRTVRAPRLAIEDVEEAGSDGPRTPAATNGRAGASLGTVAVEMSDHSIRRAQAEFALQVVAILAAVLAGAFVVARKLSRRLSQPMLNMAAAVQRIGRGEEGVRVEGSNIEVLNALASGLNDTAARLEDAKHNLQARVDAATEELRQKKEEAEQADRAKTRFLAAASHDLRQPMQALGMFASALEHSGSEKERLDLAHQIAQASNAMADLLDALLDISRLDAGRVRVNRADQPLQPIFDRLWDTFGEPAAQKDIELVVRPTDLWVNSDPVLLRQIVNNLVSNAVRYTPGGDPQRPGRVAVLARRRGEQVTIEVRDNGPGIPADAHERIFQEFEQLSNPERDRSKGLGLGLAIVQRLSRLLDHPVALRSAPGLGSTFSVTVPQADALASSAAAPAAPEEPAGLMRRRVLLIEDDALVRESVARLLRLWGCEVRESAGDPHLSVALACDGWRPEVILCDFRLAAGCTGLTIIDDVRRTCGAEVPAALITGDTEFAALRSQLPGGIQVLFKPVRPAQLRMLLQGLTAGTAAE
jgi:signal transduction histidine kinase